MDYPFKLAESHVDILSAVREEIALVISFGGHAYLCSAVERAADAIIEECDPKDLKSYDAARDDLLTAIASRLGKSTSLRRWLRLSLMAGGYGEVEAMDIAIGYEMDARLAWIDRALDLGAI